MFGGSERGLQRDNRNRPVVPCEHSDVQRGPGTAASGDSPPRAPRARSGGKHAGRQSRTGPDMGTLYFALFPFFGGMAVHIFRGFCPKTYLARVSRLPALVVFAPTIKQAAGFLDDMRRVGELDLQLNYPGTIKNCDRKFKNKSNLVM